MMLMLYLLLVEPIAFMFAYFEPNLCRSCFAYFELSLWRSCFALFVLFYFILYVLKDQNGVTPVRLKPAAPRSRDKHSTTEPLRSFFAYFEQNLTRVYVLLTLSLTYSVHVLLTLN